MQPERVQRIQSSFNRVAHRAQELMDRFFAQLFAEHPDIRQLFPRQTTDQKRCFLAGLVYVVRNLRDIENMRQPLTELGRRQVAYGMKPEHPPMFGETLVRVLGEVANDDWDDELREDWTEAVNTVCDIVLAGSRKAAYAPSAP